jgi:hypothetical protein
MEGKELVVLRNEATAAFESPPVAQPAAASDRRSLLSVFAMSALFSVAAMMWLHILADTKTSSIPSVQSASIQAQTPRAEVEIAQPIDTMTAVDDSTERTQEAAAEPEPALPKFQAWAAQKNADAPTENAQPPKVAPASDAQVKASAAQEREREQEALADKRWEERHARRLAAARKPVRGAPQPLQAQQQKPQQPQQAQKPQQLQKPAPTASATPQVVPEASDSWRGGG